MLLDIFFNTKKTILLKFYRNKLVFVFIAIFVLLSNPLLISYFRNKYPVFVFILFAYILYGLSLLVVDKQNKLK